VAPDVADAVFVSARTGDGLDTLHARLRTLSGADAVDASEGAFHRPSAPRRRARPGRPRRRGGPRATGGRGPRTGRRILAAAHDPLGEITGGSPPTALLGHIFGSFCIGK
jgi:tRNA modification GTPase